MVDYITVLLDTISMNNEITKNKAYVVGRLLTGEYVVINRSTKKIQSAWKNLQEANETASRLNKLFS